MSDEQVGSGPRRTRTGLAAAAVMTVAVAALVTWIVTSGSEADAPSGRTPPPARSSAVVPPRAPIAVEPGLDDQLTSTAKRLAAFAVGGAAHLPVDTPVELLLGGRRLTTVPAADIAQRRSWQVCPPAGSYAGGTCPFSALQVLHDAADLSLTAQPDEPPCVTWQQPRRLGAYQRVTITTGSTCADWAAVTLYVNDVAQLVAVDLTIAEP